MGIITSQAYFISPPVVTNGLIFYPDAGNKASYPGSGTSWNSQIGSNTGTLINNPTYSTAVGGNLYFDPSLNQYVNLTGISLGTVHSVELWFNPSITNSGRWIGASESTTYYFDVNGTDLTMVVGGISNTVSNSTIQIGNWNHVALTRNNTEYTVYVNGILIANQTEVAWDGLNFTLTNLGANQINGSYAQGYLSSAKAYNRVLSIEEVLQNYNAHKARFGLM